MCDEAGRHREAAMGRSITTRRTQAFGLCVSMLLMLVGPGTAQASAAPPDCADRVQVRQGSLKKPTWTTIASPEFPQGTVPDAELLQPNSIYTYATDPSDPDRLFVADRDTVLRSTDGGCTWDAVFHIPVPEIGPPPTTACEGVIGELAWVAQTPGCTRIGYLTVAPSGAKPGRVYVQLITPRSVYPGLAAVKEAGFTTTLYVSEDGGSTFSYWTDASSREGFEAQLGKGELIVAPSDPDIVYAVRTRDTDSALFASQDGGKTWALRGALPGTNDPTGLVVSSSNPKELWDVATAILSTSNPAMGLSGLSRNALIHSSDGGKSWSELETPLEIPQEVAVAEAPGGETVIAVGTQIANRIFVSRDGGSGWHELPRQQDCDLGRGGLQFGRSAHVLFASCFDQYVLRYDLKRVASTVIKQDQWSGAGGDNDELQTEFHHSVGVGLTMVINCGEHSWKGTCLLARYQGRGA